MVICWRRLFCGMHCFMIIICDAESQFKRKVLLTNSSKGITTIKKHLSMKPAAIKVNT